MTSQGIDSTIKKYVYKLMNTHSNATLEHYPWDIPKDLSTQQNFDHSINGGAEQSPQHMSHSELCGWYEIAFGCLILLKD